MADANLLTLTWQERLSGAAEERDEAIQELRVILLRGLTVSLGSRYSSGLQAEDIVQESLVKILGSLETFRGQSRFTTWAMTIATRIGISELRHKHYQDVSMDVMNLSKSLSFELAVDTSEPPECGLRRRQILQVLRDSIENDLTQKQRDATQALLDGFSVEEIALRLGSNRNAIYKLIHDARLRLKSDAIDRELPWYERMALRGHLTSCRVCRLLRRQLGLIHHAAGNCSTCEQSLSDSARQRCKDAIQKTESQ